jgi:Helicase conserved C-terminal domain
MVSLKAHQIEDLAVAIKQPRSFNLGEPGTQKTGTFCALAWYYWSRKGKKTILVQPNHLRDKNRLEMIRFTGFEPHEVAVIERVDETLGPRKRLGVAGACSKTGYINYLANPDLKVFVVGFTFLKTYWKEIIKHHPEVDLVIVDEGHEGYSTYNSKASVELYKLMDRTTGFYYCTGTPINGRLDSCFTAVHIIKPQYYGSYDGFLAQHAGFIDDYGKVMNWLNEDKVTKIFNRHGVRRLWVDVHGEQKRNIEVIDDIPMDGRMEEAYREFEAMACVELDNMFLEGANPGVATMRARQIINCPHIYGIDEKTPKQAYLEGLAQKGMVVFGSMPEEVEAAARILREAGLKVGVMHGGVSHKKRVEIDLDYQAGRLDAICATPAVSATGWNWQRTDVIVYMSLDYKDSNIEQSIKRGERELREHPLNIYFLEYEDSVDQRVRKIVLQKENLTLSVMGDVKGQSK